MSVITVSFYEGATGAAAPVPADFALRVFPPASSQQQEVQVVRAPDQKFLGVIKPGIYTVHFGTETKIVSLDPENPGDIALLVLEGDEARAYFEVYLWDLQPDNSTRLPSNSVSAGSVDLRVTCAYCDSRYTTPGSPYYQNTTWYTNCYTNPPCT